MHPVEQDSGYHIFVVPGHGSGIFGLILLIVGQQLVNIFVRLAAGGALLMAGTHMPGTLGHSRMNIKTSCVRYLETISGYTSAEHPQHSTCVQVASKSGAQVISPCHDVLVMSHVVRPDHGFIS